MEYPSRLESNCFTFVNKIMLLEVYATDLRHRSSVATIWGVDRNISRTRLKRTANENTYTPAKRAFRA